MERWHVLREAGTREPQRALMRGLQEQEERNSHTPDFFDISLSFSLWLAGTTTPAVWLLLNVPGCFLLVTVWEAEL